MSQIKNSLVSNLLLLAGMLLVVGCGTANTDSSYSPDSEQHSAGWLPAGHMQAARSDVASCRECHGVDLNGGISTVACTTCHLGGALSIHPTDWGSAILTKHGSYVLDPENGYQSCRNQYCHGNDLKGVVDSGPSCDQCH